MLLRFSADESLEEASPRRRHDGWEGRREEEDGSGRVQGQSDSEKRPVEGGLDAGIFGCSVWTSLTASHVTSQEGEIAMLGNIKVLVSEKDNERMYVH